MHSERDAIAEQLGALAELLAQALREVAKPAP